MAERPSAAAHAAQRSVRVLTILGWSMVVLAALGFAMGLVLTFHASSNAALSAADSERLRANGTVEALYNALFVLPGVIVLVVAKRLRAKVESTKARKPIT